MSAKLPLHSKDTLALMLLAQAHFQKWRTTQIWDGTNIVKNPRRQILYKQCGIRKHALE